MMWAGVRLKPHMQATQGPFKTAQGLWALREASQSPTVLHSCRALKKFCVTCKYDKRQAGLAGRC